MSDLKEDYTAKHQIKIKTRAVQCRLEVKNTNTWAGTMAQWVEDVAAEPGHQSLVPGTHMEGETQLP